jgi:plasmid stabilization system protein ParE
MTKDSSYSVFWTDQAQETAIDIVEYLRQAWTEKEVNAFLDEVDRTIKAIEIYPKLFRQSAKRKNVHHALQVLQTCVLFIQLRGCSNILTGRLCPFVNAPRL